MFNTDNYSLLSEIPTCNNPNALMAIAQNFLALSMAFPNDKEEGTIVLIYFPKYSKITGEGAIQFKEFANGQSMYEINYDGILLVSANKFGTKFRVRCCCDGALLINLKEA